MYKNNKDLIEVIKTINEAEKRLQAILFKVKEEKRRQKAVRCQRVIKGVLIDHIINWGWNEIFTNRWLFTKFNIKISQTCQNWRRY